MLWLVNKVASALWWGVIGPCLWLVLFLFVWGLTCVLFVATALAFTLSEEAQGVWILVSLAASNLFTWAFFWPAKGVEFSKTREHSRTLRETVTEVRRDR